MKHVKHLIGPALLSAALASGTVFAQSEPSIVLPPAEVIMKAAADMGVEVVNTDYVLTKLPQLLSGSKQVFVIDARPGRNYDEGHVPMAYNIFDAKFKLLYPEFEKLNIAKDAEIFLGIGRPCPMSLNNIKQLKEKGYTNLKAFVKGPVYFEKSYFEVTAKGARKAAGKGAARHLDQDPGLSRPAARPKDNSSSSSAQAKGRQLPQRPGSMADMEDRRVQRLVAEPNDGNQMKHPSCGHRRLAFCPGGCAQQAVQPQAPAGTAVAG
jgi:rhodanese-related sulfurtransferase